MGLANRNLGMAVGLADASIPAADEAGSPES